MVEKLGSIQIVIKCLLNVLYIYDRLILGEYTDGREGVREQNGGVEQHNIRGGAKRAEIWRGWVK